MEQSEKKMRPASTVIPTKPTVVYAPVYKTGHRIWVSIIGIAFDQKIAYDNAMDVAARMPSWAKENQFLRIGKFMLNELLE